MKDEIRVKFEQALNSYRAAGERAKVDLEQELVPRQIFEMQWRENRDAVVIPALTQIAELLRSKGWQCQITSTDHSVVFEIYQEQMRGVAGARRPQIAFHADPDSLRIYMRSSTQSVSSPESPGEVGSPFTEEVIQQLVLKFFQRLTAEGPPP